MNISKTLFAQLMDYLPWSTFDRIVARYDGNRAVRTLPCATQYQAMAFAQVPTERACATSRPLCRRNLPSSTTWASMVRSDVPHWPMPTRPATGVSMPSLPND